MKTNQAISLLVGLVIIAAAIIIWQVAKKPAPVSTDIQATDSSATTGGTGTSVKSSTSSNSNPATKKAPFSTMIKNGGSYFCRVNSYNYTTRNYGTVYVDGGKIRGNLTLSDETNREVNISVIVRDGYIYAWSGGYPTGYRVPTASAGKAKTLDGRNFTWNTDLIGDYQCQPWESVQASVFTIPTNIEFQDVK